MSNFVFENSKYKLTVSDKARAISLILKSSGEECLNPTEDIPLFSVTQQRPYNNEVKLAYMNKRTTYGASSLSLDGDVLTVGFEIIPYTARVKVVSKDDYITFTLLDFISDAEEKGGYSGLAMDRPPVENFRLLQLPVKNREHFGRWLGVSWDETAYVAVVATAPEAIIDSEERAECRILTADALGEVKLSGVCAALIAEDSKESFLDAVAVLECDFDIPRGVESRRMPCIDASSYWTHDLNPGNVEEHIRYAKMAGLSSILIFYKSFIKDKGSYGTCGDYFFNDKYPNGYEDLKAVVNKIKAAGLIPGVHFLHTHIGRYTHYVSPKADYRLNLKMHFTLTKSIDKDDTEIFVMENPERANTHPLCRVLYFGGELISYEGYTTSYPYRFFGCKRGAWDTEAITHREGEIGGLLDVSEFGGGSVYLNQHSDLADEIADKVAHIYNAGFEFIYFDGSEGVNPPFEYHVPNAQLRVIKKLNKAPLYCEGAAKAHFSWHIVTGGNAFDVFGSDVFKRMIDAHPLAEAKDMSDDFTRINFGWWQFFPDTRRVVYEYGTSKAEAYRCPITVIGDLKAFGEHPRCSDILGMLKKWEDVRRLDALSAEDKAKLAIPGKEYTLVETDGGYEVLPYEEVKIGDGTVSAFVFARLGRAYALIWHNTGEGEAFLPLTADTVKYEREFGKQALDFVKLSNGINICISDSAYLSAEISVDEMKDIISAMSVK